MYSADIGLMRDRFRKKFQNDRITNFIGPFDSFLLSARDSSIDSRNAVCREKLLGFVLGQDGAIQFASILDNRVSLGALGRISLLVGDERRGFVKSPQVVTVAPHVVKGAGSHVRVFEGRDAGIV